MRQSRDSRLLEWMEPFESKVLKANLGENKVMVRSGISMDDMSNSKVDPCVVCSLK